MNLSHLDCVKAHICMHSTLYGVALVGMGGSVSLFRNFRCGSFLRCSPPSLVSQKRLRTPPLRTAKLSECMSLRPEYLQSLELYSFLMSLSYYRSEIRKYVGGHD